ATLLVHVSSGASPTNRNEAMISASTDTCLWPALRLATRSRISWRSLSVVPMLLARASSYDADERSKHRAQRPGAAPDPVARACDRADRARRRAPAHRPGAPAARHAPAPRPARARPAAGGRRGARLARPLRPPRRADAAAGRPAAAARRAARRRDAAADPRV